MALTSRKGAGGRQFDELVLLILSRWFHKYQHVYLLIFRAAYGVVAASSWRSLLIPRKSPFDIELSAAEAEELNRRSAKYTLPYFKVIRAKMILMAAAGIDNDEIAARLDTRREAVSQWRKRFFKERLAGLEERARPGRPRVFPPKSSPLRSRRWPASCRPRWACRCLA